MTPDWAWMPSSNACLSPFGCWLGWGGWRRGLGWWYVRWRICWRYRRRSRRDGGIRWRRRSCGGLCGGASAGGCAADDSNGRGYGARFGWRGRRCGGWLERGTGGGRGTGCKCEGRRRRCWRPGGRQSLKDYRFGRRYELSRLLGRKGIHGAGWIDKNDGEGAYQSQNTGQNQDG